MFVKRFVMKADRSDENVMRVMLLNPTLAFGGAEALLIELAAGLKKRGHQVMVVTFWDDHPLGPSLTEAGVPLECLQTRGRWDIHSIVWRFLDSVQRFQPSVIYTILPASNLVALTARFVKWDFKLIWGVSTTELDFRSYRRLTRLSYWLEAKLGRFADLVISNSHAAVECAVRRGFPKAIMRVVPIGVDTVRYRPDPAARRRIRDEWGITDGDRLIGLVGRLDPRKDIPTFLAAAADLAPFDDRVRFVVVGNGAQDYRTTLMAQAAQWGIGSRILWMPARNGIEEVYNALDLIVSSSLVEGSSVVLIEAMACGTSIVATDVGDSALTAAEWGEVVPPRSPAALATAIRRQLARLGSDGEAIAAGCRRHIIENFSAELLVSKTEALMYSLFEPCCRIFANGDTIKE